LRLPPNVCRVYFGGEWEGGMAGRAGMRAE